MIFASKTLYLNKKGRKGLLVNKETFFLMNSHLNQNLDLSRYLKNIVKFKEEDFITIIICFAFNTNI